MRTFIVEDDETQRMMIEVMAASLGHEVRSFSDIESAWQVLSNETCDLLLLDLVIRDACGLDLCRRVHNNRSLPVPYVLIVSGRTEEATVDKALRLGANDYLAKPFGPSTLQRRLKIAEFRISQRSSNHDVFSPANNQHHA